MVQNETKFWRKSISMFEFIIRTEYTVRMVIKFQQIKLAIYQYTEWMNNLLDLELI